jgi:hypothetical protein
VTPAKWDPLVIRIVADVIASLRLTSLPPGSGHAAFASEGLVLRSKRFGSSG